MIPVETEANKHTFNTAFLKTVFIAFTLFLYNNLVIFSNNLKH